MLWKEMAMATHRASRKAERLARRIFVNRYPRRRYRSLGIRPRREVWWAVPFLLVLFLLSSLLGAGFAVRGGGEDLADDLKPVPSSSQSLSVSAGEVGHERIEPTSGMPAGDGEPGRRAGAPRPVAETKKVHLRYGDTLYSLAVQHGTTVKTLQKMNGLGTSTLILAGEALRIPRTDEGKIIHAPRSGHSVTVTPLPDASDGVHYRHTGK
ncbi:LysM peptidoglycan-binding domain-containing protein [Streptomyces sp. NPDC020412]|uniref:LysM peptidoglycan-binding domain-containing protein n=1 Tax=Streptomyces sp. NPDC020412 TaxID=3365073 RepID=UPI00378947F9